ncbi:MAG: MATE family efflux transporter [Porticoccaceae bacterium]|nr:MATE family efflux transporter [Porticoccaceae bacterium]
MAMAAAQMLLRQDFARLFSPDRAITVLAAELFFFSAFLECVDYLHIACRGALRSLQDVKVPLFIQILAF